MPTNITCWGDSLTSGTGAATGLDYPTVLSGLLGRTVFNGGNPGDTSAQILTRVLADSTHVNDLCIFWMGRDDSPKPGNIAANIASAVAHLGSNTKYLVMSVENAVAECKGCGGGGDALHTQIVTLNASLMATYGIRGFDVRAFMIHQYNPVAPADVTSHWTDIPPASLLYDTVHFLATGYALIAARLAARITELGW